MKSWYSIQAKADQAAEISIYDEIGFWGVTAKQFIGDLKAIDATTIKLAINSPGGATMATILRQFDSAYDALKNRLGEPGEKGVTFIEENEPHNGMQLWNYVVHLEDGTKYRIFNPNFVEYFAP